MTSTKNTNIGFNIIYLVISIFLLVLVVLEKNLLDILYFGLLTFYYIRIKKYRSCR